MELTIYTSFDCLIKGEGVEEFLSENENLYFHSPPPNLVVYPAKRFRRPSFQIDLKKIDSRFYKIIEKDNRLLVFLIDGIFALNYLVEKITCEGKLCQVEVGKNDVSFLCENNKKVLNIASEILSSSCGQFFHIAYAKLVSADCEYLIAYNTRTSQAKIIKGQSIDINDEGFTVKYSSFGYKEVCETFLATKDGLKIKERTFSAHSATFSPRILCWRFMDAIKKADFSSAYSMLSPALKEKISVSSIKEFFGNVSFFSPINETSFFALSHGKSQIYSFSLTDNLIDEISND